MTVITTIMENNMAIAVGSKIEVTQGCHALGIVKGSAAKIKSIIELGPDYSHAVKLELHFLNSSASGKTFRLYARHVNRLSDAHVHLNSGNPSHKITVVSRG